MNVDTYFRSKYSGLYKSKASLSRNRKVEQKEKEIDRREKRRATVNANRNIQDEPDDAIENIPPPSKAELKRLRLMKWKKEKEEILIKNKRNAKKPFVVGIVHHKINSPVTVFSNVKKQTSSTRNAAKPLVTTEKKVGKQERRTELKKKNVALEPLSTNLAVFPFSNNKVKASNAFKFKVLPASSSKKLTQPTTPSFIRKEATRKVQLKQYFFPQRKNPGEKKSSSDEELAVPLSPAIRVTRSRNQSKADVKLVQIGQPQQEKTPEEKITKPALKKQLSKGKPKSAKTSEITNQLVEETQDLTQPSVTEPLPSRETKAASKLSDVFSPQPLTPVLPMQLVEGQDLTKSSITKTLPSRETKAASKLSDVFSPQPLTPVLPMQLVEGQDLTKSSITKTGPVMEVNSEDEGTSIRMKIQNIPTTPPNDFVLSPFVTVERGKRSSRRSSIFKPSPQQKISLRDAPAHDESVEGPTFQKKRLNNETSRLLLLADDWEKIAGLEDLNQDIIDDIDLVVGQTRLLTRDKFQQFRKLIDQHEENHETIKVTLDDLNGFWEMMYLQVNDLIKKYERLEALKSNNWMEPQLSLKKKARKPRKKKTVVSAKSSIHDFIKEKKTTAEQTSLENVEVLTNDVKKRRSSIQNSPAAYNALQLSFISKEYGKSPMIMVTNDMCETPKSCLKIKPNSILEKKSVRKTVLFNQIVEFELIENQNMESPNNKRSMNNSDMETIFTPRRSARLSIKNSMVSSS